MKMKKCIHCRAEIIAIARICRYCRRHLFMSPVPWVIHLSVLAFIAVIMGLARYYWGHPM
ncbi:MAG TPA: hypothetical protein VD913_03350 [bacterium]|nr:hypothetical protein [bacterium]